MMLKALGLAVAILASGTLAASAQGVKVEVPGVKVETPRVDVERRDRQDEKRVIETDGRGPRGGCDSKSVTKKEPGETKTVTKENCGGGS
jgi:hypothetical protein